MISGSDVTPVEQGDLRLEDGSRVAVMGSGPAGSFVSYFMLEMAFRAGLEIDVDIFEPRDFSRTAPHGCNMCGGIISETLVQNLAAEGINLPSSVVQRGIDSYMLHMDVGSVRIETPLHEKRIGAVYRGSGPPAPAGTGS
jgi:flavin-dependent dehydrogenase